MPPNSSQQETTGVLFEADAETIDGGLVRESVPTKNPRKLKWVWRNIVLFGYLHLAAVYGGWLLFTSAKWQTILFAIVHHIGCAFGITAGVHRLWAHRAYKAKWPLRVILMIFNSMGFEDSVYHWARDHRVHHKYTESDADPHDNRRGFFFSHIGWLLTRKDPEVKAKGKLIDLSDLEADPIVMFQRKYYYILMPLCCFILPTLAPMYFWNETLSNALFGATLFRWCFLLHSTWLVNSAAHMFGNKPFDKSIKPSENIPVALIAFGEGWHNYHHVFPWDYKAAELGNYSLNFTNAFIHFFAKIGWAYDLKSVSPEIIKKRTKRTGDGTHPIWGWGDKDQLKEEIDDALITNKKSK